MQIFHLIRMLDTWLFFRFFKVERYIIIRHLPTFAEVMSYSKRYEFSASILMRRYSLEQHLFITVNVICFGVTASILFYSLRHRTPLIRSATHWNDVVQKLIRRWSHCARFAAAREWAPCQRKTSTFHRTKSYPLLIIYAVRSFHLYKLHDNNNNIIITRD